jgi:predicted regulator of Ras-like GTPase activity (Roadblock/LC7/MglB family)
MPYRSLLEDLVRRVRGAQGALLLDATGEVVVEAGAKDDRHRLIGAYQGIALATAQRTSARYAIGSVAHIHCRYAWGHVILRPLRDGYYFVLSVAPHGNVGEAIYRSAGTQDRMNAEL